MTPAREGARSDQGESGEALSGPPLTTEDLILREFREEDAAAVHAYASDPEVVRFEEWGPNTEAESEAFVARILAERKSEPRLAYELAVTLRDGGALIGACGLRCDPDQPAVACLGYTLNRAYWGRGFGTQIARALVEFALDELGVTSVWARCHKDNVASLRILEKVGLSRTAGYHSDVWTLYELRR